MCSNIYGYIRSNYIIIALIVRKSHLSLYLFIQYTKQNIRRLLEIEEEKRKTQQDPLSSSKEDTDDSVDTTQGNYTMIISL